MLLQPVCDGYPTQSPATGKTPAGSASSSASFSTWLRTTLMGQQPSPSAAAAVMKPCKTSPASTAAFMNMSSVSLGKGRPRSSATRRMRRLSPQNTMKSGAVAIQGMSGRSEEHTSELQSPYDLVCRLLLEKKKINQKNLAIRTPTSVKPLRSLG